MFSWFRKKTEARGHAFTEEEADRSRIARLEKAIRENRIKFLRDKLERIKTKYEERDLNEQITEMEDDFYDDEDDDEIGPDDLAALALNDPDTQLKLLFVNALKAGQKKNPPAGQAAQEPTQYHLSDEQIRQMKARIPQNELKVMRKLKPEQLVEYVRLHHPDVIEQLDEDTQRRAMLIIQQEAV
jgi:hypothetical protein